MLCSALSPLVHVHARRHAALNIVQTAGQVVLYYGSACLVRGFGCAEDSNGGWRYLITIGRSARCSSWSQHSQNQHVTTDQIARVMDQMARAMVRMAVKAAVAVAAKMAVVEAFIVGAARTAVEVSFAATARMAVEASVAVVAKVRVGRMRAKTWMTKTASQMTAIPVTTRAMTWMMAATMQTMNLKMMKCSTSC